MSFRRLRLAAVFVVFGILLGTLGFHFLEDTDWFNAFYWMSAEFTLVGANDFSPHTYWGKAITIILFWTGVGTVSTVVSAAVNLDSRRLKQEISLSKIGFKNHAIVVGVGALGAAVLESLRALGEKKIVLIENNLTAAKQFEEKGNMVISGDGAADEILTKAKIQDARLLVVATGNDSTNILTAIKGRSLNSKIYIVARAKMQENYQKMSEYADLVVSPTMVGATLMALGETPEVSRFVHHILDLKEGQRLWEVTATSSSSAVGRTLEDLQLKERFNVSLLAIRTGQGFLVNPDQKTLLKPGDTLILLAKESDFKEARSILST